MEKLADLEYEVLAPKSGNKAKSVVFLLHGLGSNAQDLMGLVPHWQDQLPDTEFVSPNAPYPCDMSGGVGYQWFSLQDRAPKPMLAGVQAAHPILSGFMDAHLKRLGLKAENCAVVGFSQGSMMAMYSLPRFHVKCAGMVCYSGGLIDDGKMATESDELQRVKTMLIHGTADDVVPFAAFEQAGQVLQNAGFEVEGLACQGLGHSIDESGLRSGGKFLAEALS